MNKDSAISTLGLSKIYNKNNQNIKALDEFSINIPKGSIYGLLGPNGAGKSTFINIIAGLVKKSAGKVTISGSDLDINQIEIKKKIGIVPQELNIDPFFTPYELLELQAGLYGVKKQDRKTNEILDKMQLLENKNSYASSFIRRNEKKIANSKSSCP